MKHRSLVLSLASAMLLLGCASMLPSAPHAVEPVMAVRNGGVDAEGMYRIGRYYQGQGRHDEASKAFRAALDLDPAHAEARNALGVTYFVQGWIDKAEQQFRQAIAAAPDLAHLRNNLARLYTLTGRQPVDGAARAALAPPVAPRPTPTETALARAASAPVSDPAPASSSAPAPVPASASAPASAPVSAVASRLVSVAPNVWELKSTATPSSPAAQAKTLVSAANRSAPRVEVSNGNGVQGLARRVAQFMAIQGYRQTRTGNLPAFNQRRTEVQYRAGAQRQARELATLLGARVRLVPVAALEHDVTVRLILGHDFKESDRVLRAAQFAPIGQTFAMTQ